MTLAIKDYRPPAVMKHNPAPHPIIFNKMNLFGDDFYVSPKSKFVIAYKPPKKSPKVLVTFPYGEVKKAVDFFIDKQGQKRKKGDEYFFLIETDELFHECLVKRS